MIETGKIHFTEEWEVLHIKETKKAGTYKKKLLPILERQRHDTSLWRSGDDVSFEIVKDHKKIDHARVIRVKTSL